MSTVPKNAQTIPFKGVAGAGRLIYVDPADYALVARHSWMYKDGYAVSSARDFRTGKKKEIRMHRLILGTMDPEVIVDHIDGNRANNTRANLREYTPIENANNRCDNRRVFAFGEWQTVAEWSRDPRCSVNYDVLYGRIRDGVWPEFAMLAPKEERA